MSRQGDILLPPLYYSIWLDSDFEIPTARTANKYLSHFYSKVPRSDGSYDRNINNHRWEDVWALGLPVVRGWSDVCQIARSAVLSNLRSATDLDNELKRVLEGMSQKDKVYFSQRQSRLSLLSSDECEREQYDLETEICPSRVSSRRHCGTQNNYRFCWGSVYLRHRAIQVNEGDFRFSKPKVSSRRLAQQPTRR